MNENNALCTVWLVNVYLFDFAGVETNDVADAALWIRSPTVRLSCLVDSFGSWHNPRQKHTLASFQQDSDTNHNVFLFLSLYFLKFSFLFSLFFTWPASLPGPYCVPAAHRLALTLPSHLRIINDFLYVCLYAIYPSIVQWISCVNACRGRRLLCSRMCMFINQSALNSLKLTYLRFNNEIVQQWFVMNDFISV